MPTLTLLLSHALAHALALAPALLSTPQDLARPGAAGLGDRYYPTLGNGGYDALHSRFLPGSPVVAGSTGEIAFAWAPYRPDLGAAAIERLLDDISLDVLADPAALFPAAPDLPAILAKLGASGRPLGVATHDSELGAKVQLTAAGIIDAFSFIAGYDSGHGLKPGPGMLLAFARTMEIDPAGVAMVGDSRHDLEVARSAGAALAIGVLTGPAQHADLAPFADHILPSIEHLPALLARLRV